MPGVNGWVLKWVVGLVTTLTITALGFMGNGIVANDVRNTKDHTQIRRELKETEDDLDEKLSEVHKDVVQIQIQQARVLEILEKNYE